MWPRICEVNGPLGSRTNRTNDLERLHMNLESIVPRFTPTSLCNRQHRPKSIGIYFWHIGQTFLAFAIIFNFKPLLSVTGNPQKQAGSNQFQDRVNPKKLSIIAHSQKYYFFHRRTNPRGNCVVFSYFVVLRRHS